MIYFSNDLIKKAIAKKLKDCLTVTTPEGTIPPIIFADKIQEGATEPFFLILVIDVSQRNGMRNTYWRTYQMKVQYYVDETVSTRITDLRIMGERLLGILNVIDVEYSTRGGQVSTRPLKSKKLDYQITENVLNFFCTYNVKVYREMDPNEKMQVLQINRMED